MSYATGCLSGRPEQMDKDQLKTGFEEVILNTNKVLHTWFREKDTNKDARDFMQVRSMCKSWISRIISHRLGYRAISAIEITMTLAPDSPRVASLSAYEPRAGSYRRYGMETDLCNEIFRSINYEDLTFTEARFDSYRTKMYPEAKQPMTIVDYYKLNSYNF